VVDFAQKHPDRIRLFLNDRKNVIYVDGKPTGRWNLVNNLRNAEGEYIALLEGDDYWTAPDKLQRQADFLDSHPECALCFHAVMRRYEEEDREAVSFRAPRTRQFYSLEDLLEGNMIAACSVMFRNRLFGEFPDWYLTVPMGDWPLHILNAQHGNIGYIDEVMAVYRIHGGGLRSSAQAVHKLRASTALLETVRRHLGPRYHRQLSDGITRRRMELVYLYLRNGDLTGARSAIRELFAARPLAFGSWLRAVVWMVRRAGSANRSLSKRAP
jgi:hypothetical protein